MKANELMIGDWLLYYDADENQNIPVKIVSIDDDGWVFYEYPDATRQEGWCKDLNPVPLTPEILEKNGFTRFGTDYILKERHFGLENPSTPSNYFDNYWLRVSIEAVHIEFVHQLQHALRLCGIEKEITL